MGSMDSKVFKVHRLKSYENIRNMMNEKYAKFQIKKIKMHQNEIFEWILKAFEGVLTAYMQQNFI